MASLLHTRSPSCSRPSLPSPTFPIFRSSQHPRHWSPQILHHHHCATFRHWGQVSNGPNKSVQQKQPAQKHERGHTREAPALQGAEDAGLLLIDQSEKSADTVQGPAPPGKGSPLAATTLQRSALNLQKQIMNFALWQDHRPLRCQPHLHCLAWSKRGTAQESRELISRDTGRRQKKRSDTYTGSQCDKASFTTLSLHYPVCIHEKVKSTSLLNKFLCLGLLLASFADSAEAGSTWENKLLFYQAALLVLS